MEKEREARPKGEKSQNVLSVADTIGVNAGEPIQKVKETLEEEKESVLKHLTKGKARKEEKMARKGKVRDQKEKEKARTKEKANMVLVASAKSGQNTLRTTQEPRPKTKMHGGMKMTRGAGQTHGEMRPAKCQWDHLLVRSEEMTAPFWQADPEVSLLSEAVQAVELLVLTPSQAISREDSKVPPAPTGGNGPKSQKRP